MALTSLVVMTSVAFTSCKDDDDDDKGSLIGEWFWHGDDDYNVFRFDEDGTWWRKREEGGEYSRKGSYVYTDGVIYLSYLTPDEPVWGDSWKVVKLTSSELVVDVTFHSGKTATVNLSRVK
jgi:hypothetical protein